MIHGVLLLVSMLGVQADRPATEELRAEVRRLVRQLDSPQLERRDAAEAALLQLGPAVLDLLPEETDRTPAEVRQRLARVRQKLQQSASDAAADASTVTLDARSTPLSVVLAAFEQQSGNSIVDYRRRFGQPTTDTELKIDFERTPFWPALDRVLDQAGLTVYPFAERRAIGVVSKVGGKQTARFGRACYSGPLRFEATGIVARRDLLEQDGRSLIVTVEAAWEPRLRAIILLQRMADVTAVDRSGRPLPVADPQAQLETSPSGAASAVKLNLAFAPPSDDVRQIASLKGKLIATLPGRTETFRFRNLSAAKNVKHRIAGVTVTLEQVRKTNHKAAAETWEARIRVRFDDAGDALESHRTWIFDNAAFLEGPDGKPVSYGSYETTAQGENEVGVAFSFTVEGPIDRYSFVYKTPGSIITHGFDYELKDIPLP
ncbi:MAG: hypothetical protein KKE86_06325 [Planctomycetes bacterium]|nr:hypothetical protein [Planctomycetota bacterium]